MSTIKVLVLVIIAFTLGFGVSEYMSEHNSQQKVVYIPYETSITFDHPNTEQNIPILSQNSLNAPLPINSVGTGATAKAAAFSWETVKQFIDNAHYDEAIRLLQTQLGNPKNAPQAWYFLANIYKKQSQPNAALDAWFRYLALEINPQKIDKALVQIKNYLIQLKEQPALFNEDYSWLIAQCDALLKYTANDGDLHLIMAELYSKLNDSYQAQYHALMAVNDPKVQKQAEDILASLNGKKLEEDINIPLIVAGNKYILMASIEGNPVRFLLDTGASLSGLANSYTAKYPSLIKNTKPIRLNTASGIQNSFLFTVNNINIGSLEFKQHILAQLSMDNADGFDGLLGVDILGRFDFVIDQNAAVLHLKARKNNP